MQQLTGLDAMFLSIDTSTTTGVIGGLLVYERPDDEVSGRAPAMRVRIADRLDQLPPLRWRVASVPLALDHAYWAEVDRVDVGEHVRSLTLPAPGSDQQLAAEVARVMSLPLSTDKPMWDYHVIEGLEGGRVAHLFRIHHALIDGGTVPVILDLLSDSPVTPPGQFKKMPAPRRPEPIGGRAEMLARGLVGTALRPARMAGLQVANTRWLVGRLREDGLLAPVTFMARLTPGELGAPLRKLVNLRQRAAGASQVLPIVPTLFKPRTPFNKTLSGRRSYAFSDLPLADFKTVGKAFGATLNDVVLAVCAGALRRYLLTRGGIPDRPLVVCIPASVRSEKQKGDWANHVSMFFAPLPTHLDDPLDRLRAVSSDVKAAKANFDSLPVHLIRPATRLLPQAMFSVPQRLLAKAPDWLPASTWNVVVSNVRGPAQPVITTGARMVGYWPAAFLTPGVGLNITLQSYVDRVDFGFMGCTDLTGDLWELPEYMGAELDRLLEEARKVVSGPGRSARTRKTARRRQAPLRSADTGATDIGPADTGPTQIPQIPG